MKRLYSRGGYIMRQEGQFDIWSDPTALKNAINKITVTTRNDTKPCERCVSCGSSEFRDSGHCAYCRQYRK